MTADLGLGTMAFASPTADPSQCRAILERAIDDGITFIDTADAYGRGAVEELIGPVLARRREVVQVASKLGLPTSEDPDDRGLAPARVRRAVQASLGRLGLERIDLEQCHRPDPGVPVEETLEALDALRSEGLIGGFGASCFGADLLSRAAAHTSGGFAYEQSPYSILVRSREHDVFPVCADLGVGIIAWSPLNGGWLTGKYHPDRDPPPDSRAARPGTFVRSDDERKAALVARLETVARSAGLPLVHLALAWVASRPGVTHVLIGPRTLAQYEQLIGARHVRLDADTLAAVDAVVPPGTTVDPANDARS